MAGRSVELVDRSEMVNTLRANLVIDPRRTAVVLVDMQRGHLDPPLATMPVPAAEAARVVEQAAKLLALGRDLDLPIVHLGLVRRRIESEHPNPVQQHFEPLRQAILGYNVEGTPQAEFMPAVAPRAGEHVITSKKQLDGFFGTDLEYLLQILGVDTLLIGGVNTNTCVLNTCFGAFNRRFKVVVIEECVASMHGHDLHIFGLENVRRILGWVLTLAELREKLGVGAAVGARGTGA